MTAERIRRRFRSYQESISGLGFSNLLPKGKLPYLEE
jgi:hypothetical protein